MSDELLEKADEAAKNAYAPYSNYNVGAIVRASDGATGCPGSTAGSSPGDGGAVVAIWRVSSAIWRCSAAIS